MGVVDSARYGGVGLVGTWPRGALGVIPGHIVDKDVHRNEPSAAAPADDHQAGTGQRFGDRSSSAGHMTGFTSGAGSIHAQVCGRRVETR